MKEAYIAEIFQSIQGEGPYVGLPFVFIRFSGCNMDCKYCDTKWAREFKIPTCRVHINGQTRTLKNPVSIDDLESIIEEFNTARITFTGGEPLCSAGLIENLLPRLEKHWTLMETNGTIPSAVSDILLEKIDSWSVDIKLPSITGYSVLQENRIFINKLQSAKNIVLKAVFSSRSPLSEITAALDIAREFYQINKNVTLVYQPLSKGKKIPLGKNAQSILEFSRDSLFEIRMIPQIHKILNVE